MKRLLLLLLLLVPLVSGYNVELVEKDSTPFCFNDCQTVYKITSGKDGVLGENDFWFEFRDDKDLSLRHADNVKDLLSYGVQVGVRKSRVVDFPVFERQNCFNDVDVNKTLICENVYGYEKRTEFYYDWQNITEPLSTKKDGVFYLRVFGSKDKTASVDNVLVLKNDAGKFDKFTQWYWWGSYALDTRLVSYYSFDNATSTSVTDLKGLNNLTNVYGTPVITTVKKGTGANFSGTSSFGSNGDVFDIADGSIVLWFKFAEEVGDTWDTLVSQYDDEFTIALNPAGDLLARTTFSGGSYHDVVINKTAIVANQTYFLAYTWNTSTASDKINIYLGNATHWLGLVNSSAGNWGTINDAGWRFEVGATPYATIPGTAHAYRLEGAVDEIGIYDVDWSAGNTTDDFFEALWNATSGCNPILYNTCNGTTVPPTPSFGPINYTITYSSVVAETSGYDISINYSFPNDVLNITDSNMTYFNDHYTFNASEFGLTAGSNWSKFNYTYVRAPVVDLNATVLQFNFTFYNLLANTTNYTNTTNTTNQTVYYGYYPINVTVTTANITETYTDYIEADYDMVGNQSDVTFDYLISYDGVNQTSLSIYLDSNLSIRGFNATPGLIGSGYGTNKTVNITPYVNVTFKGRSAVHNRTASDGIQTVNKMVVTDCLTLASGVGVHYFLRDIDTNALISTADLVTNFDLWNASQSLRRQYTLSWIDNSTPNVCMLPNFAFLYSNISSTASADGYEANTVVNTAESLFVGTTNITIYLTNSTMGDAIIFNVIDENEDDVENVLINIEWYNNSLYTTVANGYTDWQGQKKFYLNTTKEYRINLTYNNILMTLINGNPASVGPFEILDSEIVFRVMFENYTGIHGLAEIQDFDYNLTSYMQFDWLDSNISDSVTFTVDYINNTNVTQVYSSSSTNDAGTMSLDISTLPVGKYIGRAYLENSFDHQTYLIDEVEVDTSSNGIWGTDGLFFAWLGIIICVLLMSWHPALSLICGIFCVIVFIWSGLYTASLISVGGLVVMVFIAIVKFRKL